MRLRWEPNNNQHFLTKIYYVAVAYPAVFQPTIVEKFDNLADAREYAALMCRVKKQNYIVLTQESEWNGAQENA